jgi:hypothetical protein
MDSGEFKAVLPKNPTDDDLKAWRKDHGVPDKSESYDLRGLKIEEDDRPTVNAILAVAHKNHYSPEQARAAVSAFYEIAQAQENAATEMEEADRGKALDALSAEWGSNFTRNKNLIGNVLNRFPEAVREKLKNARFADGTAAFNDPDILRGFVAIELERNPVGIVAPGGDGDLGKSMIDRYSEIQKTMRENRRAYDKDDSMQKEFRQLVTALEKNNLIDKNGNIKKAA